MSIDQVRGFLGSALGRFGIALGLFLGLACGTTGGLKTGHVDIDLALKSSTLGKAAQEVFGHKQGEAEARMQPLIDRYKALEEEIEAKKLALSEEALFNKKLDLAEIRNTIRHRMKETEGQLLIDKKRIEGPLVKKLVEVVESIGSGEGFDLIIRASTGAPLYRRPGLSGRASAGRRDGVDLTRRVVRELDSSYSETDGAP
jgi:Skp family chaperone for outer membrane proteins